MGPSDVIEQTRRTIVVLNGPSSSGKTTLAKAIQQAGGPDWAVLSIDTLYGLLHPDRDAGWATYMGLTKALFAAARALAESGISVVVDTVFERKECVAVLQDELRELPVVLVGLKCPEDVLEARERERGNRPAGQARRQNGYVHSFCDYDLDLDTSELGVEDCVQQVQTGISEDSSR